MAEHSTAQLTLADHHLQRLAEPVLAARGHHDVGVVPHGGRGAVYGLLQGAQLLQQAGVARGGEVLQRGLQRRAGQLDGPRAGHGEAQLAEGEHLRVGEAAGERDHVGRGGGQDLGHLPDERGLPPRGHLVDEPRVLHHGGAEAAAAPLLSRNREQYRKRGALGLAAGAKICCVPCLCSQYILCHSVCSEQAV